MIGLPTPRGAWRRSSLSALSGLLLCLAAGAPAGAEEIASFSGLAQALAQCFKAPLQADDAVTLRFSLDRAGRLIGPPRLTYRHLTGSQEHQRVVIEAAFAALQACTPVRWSAGLRHDLAGQPMTLTLGAGRPMLRLQDS